MSEKQKTAVEWFALELYEKFEMKGNGTIYNELLDKAKELHMKQIETAFSKGQESQLEYFHERKTDFATGKQYYLGTYEH